MTRPQDRPFETDVSWTMARWHRSLLRLDLLPVWFVLTVWTGLSWLVFAEDHFMGSWRIFPEAGQILLRSGPAGGLHLYHIRPDFQFGPVSTLVALPLAHLPLLVSAGIAGALMTAGGLWLVGLIAGVTADGVGRVRRDALLVGGLVAMPIWVLLSVGSGHLDDVLALGFGLFGVLQVRRGNPIWAAVLLALAVDSKPWALAFGVALLALPRNSWLRSASTFVGLIVVAWLPFFIVEPRTMDAIKYQVYVAHGSVLRLIEPLGTPIPAWVRPAQLILTVAVGFVMVRGGIVQATLLATVAGRILLDPEAASYYTAGAVVAAFLVDRVSGRKVPWFALSVALFLWVPALFPYEPGWNRITGGLRLVWGLGTLLALIYLARPSGRHVKGRENREPPWPSSSTASSRLGVSHPSAADNDGDDRAMVPTALQSHPKDQTNG